MERWYLATLLALILHQIDAAFWHEWDMFSVPGGIQGFLVFNLAAVGALLRGYRQVALASRPRERMPAYAGWWVPALRQSTSHLQLLGVRNSISLCPSQS